MMNREYFIDFDTKEMPGRIVGVKVTLDNQILTDMKREVRIDLCDHPLYPKLVRYVQSNPPKEN